MQINMQTNGAVLAAVWMSRRVDAKPAAIVGQYAILSDESDLWVRGENEQLQPHFTRDGQFTSDHLLTNLIAEA